MKKNEQLDEHEILIQEINEKIGLAELYLDDGAYLSAGIKFIEANIIKNQAMGVKNAKQETINAIIKYFKGKQ